MSDYDDAMNDYDCYRNTGENREYFEDEVPDEYDTPDEYDEPDEYNERDMAIIRIPPPPTTARRTTQPAAASLLPSPWSVSSPSSSTCSGEPQHCLN